VSQRAKKNNRNNLQKRKRRIEKRLSQRQWEDEPKPIMTANNIHYEVSSKTDAMNCGGIGAIHQMVKKVGLDKQLDEDLRLLKCHLPYHESDHVLNIAYNVLTGGTRLEDIERLRNNDVFLNALGAQRIPDPTTAGDFTRRFDEDSIIQMMESINTIRQRLWNKRGNEFLDNEALIDIDGTFAPTFGQCKGGMDISYNGIWGYHPLVISLANTKEILYLVNRPANVPSHTGCAEWIDKAIELLSNHTERICLRGDTDFSLTEHFDKWSDTADFIFGMDSCKGLINRAEALPADAWNSLIRKEKYTVACERKRPKNIKEQVVVKRNFKNICLVGEDIAEFEYRPTKCKKTYRLVVLRKNLTTKQGEDVLFDNIKYFFYITPNRELSSRDIVEKANGRCDQENVIEQLKNGVNALRMPVDNLLSNWAYMVMAALAWNLKGWFGMMTHFRKRGREIIKMEFRQFLNEIILIPCQILRQGRKVTYRILGYSRWIKDLLTAWDRIRNLHLT
jgi:hypothetical protein